MHCLLVQTPEQQSPLPLQLKPRGKLYAPELPTQHTYPSIPMLMVWRPAQQFDPPTMASPWPAGAQHRPCVQGPAQQSESILHAALVDPQHLPLTQYSLLQQLLPLQG
jgi:hypothetical protein